MFNVDYSIKSFAVGSDGQGRSGVFDLVGNEGADRTDENEGKKNDILSRDVSVSNLLR